MIQVVVCSPVPALRAGLSALLSSDPTLAVAANAPALEDLPGALPDECVVVATPGGVDLAEMPPAGGMALLLIGGDPAEFAPDALRLLAAAGLRGWGVITPEATAEALQAAVHALDEGLLAISPEVLQLALNGAILPAGSPGGAVLPPVEEGLPAERLTEREIDVLRLMAQGLTNKQAALALHISEHTVKFHVSSIYAKLGAANRTEAVRKGAHRGWIPL